MGADELRKSRGNAPVVRFSYCSGNSNNNLNSQKLNPVQNNIMKREERDPPVYQSSGAEIIQHGLGFDVNEMDP